jgi:hypothetical protein
MKKYVLELAIEFAAVDLPELTESVVKDFLRGRAVKMADKLDRKFAAVADFKERVYIDCTDVEQTVASLVHKLQACGVDDEECLDEDVHETADRTASTVNNDGVESQVRYLIEELGKTEAEVIVEKLCRDAHKNNQKRKLLELEDQIEAEQLGYFDPPPGATFHDDPRHTTPEGSGSQECPAGRVRTSVEHEGASERLHGDQLSSAVCVRDEEERRREWKRDVSTLAEVLLQLQANRGVISCSWWEYPTDIDDLEELLPESIAFRMSLIVAGAAWSLNNWLLHSHLEANRNRVIAYSHDRQLGDSEDCLCIME